MTLAFEENYQLIDATRLSKSAKATIQSTGRLSLSGDAAKLMNVQEGQTILIFEDKQKEHNLAAVVIDGKDDRGFFVKKSGPTIYLKMKNYFDQTGVDYVNLRVIYDITQIAGEFEGHPIYKLSYRAIARGSEEDKKEGEE